MGILLYHPRNLRLLPSLEVAPQAAAAAAAAAKTSSVAVRRLLRCGVALSVLRFVCNSNSLLDFFYSHRRLHRPIPTFFLSRSLYCVSPPYHLFIRIHEHASARLVTARSDTARKSQLLFGPFQFSSIHSPQPPPPPPPLPPPIPSYPPSRTAPAPLPDGAYCGAPFGRAAIFCAHNCARD